MIQCWKHINLFKLYVFCISFLLLECNFQPNNKIAENQINSKLLKPKGKSISSRFKVPKNHTRVQYSENSFAYYLQNFPLKSNHKEVELYNGDLKKRQDVHVAILDVDVGNKNLQQCADAVIRLRAEYLWENKQYDKIGFHFTNGFWADYQKWQEGYRIQVQGNEVKWVKQTNFSKTYESFRQYLETIFIYAGTISVSQEMQKQQLENIEVGDAFVQGGSPGHAIIVVDKAINDEGKSIILFAQSYMPAQEIHIIKNPNNSELSPWYSVEEIQNTLETPEWKFNIKHLRKF